MHIAARVWNALAADPRHGQIVTLASLVAYGIVALDFEVSGPQVLITVGTALCLQRAGDAWLGTPWRSGAKSALISALSLCLLLRTNTLALAAVGSALAIGSKFVIRARGKHVFNPTNFALASLLIATPAVWVSPGQWGTPAIFAFALASAGLAVTSRSSRSDVTLAFIAAYATLVVGRSVALGEPLTIPLHRLQSGAFLLFSFFMISDPKTTPDSRAGRILYALLIATGAAYVHFRLFRPNGFLWALVLTSPLVPLMDRVLPAVRYEWPRSLTPRHNFDWRTSMVRKTALFMFAALTLLGSASSAAAFCGFYVARADTKVFNRASQVALARDGNRTVITMANDFRGDPREFAMVIPVPTAITREQIHVAEPAVLAHLDAYTAPRLVEYFDADPCARPELMMERALPMANSAAPVRAAADSRRAKNLGVTIEARYSVGEYDILILSARQSSGLETWLRENGYRVPAGASAVLGSYIKQDMRFFVAKVNLAAQSALGFTTLRPLQVAYESPKFMLPIRLGMVNADGPQELFIYALTRKGRVESSNYRTVKLRTDLEIPTYLKDPAEFATMYKAMFDAHVRREQMSAVFQEYAWDMAWCDPCAADPLSRDELRKLGVFWLDEVVGRPWEDRRNVTGGQDVFVTRLHVRYDQSHFPEDLTFHETGDRTNFQGRYVLRHAYTGPATCEAAVTYQRTLRDRRERDAQTLASLTGWPVEDIRRKQGTGQTAPLPPVAAPARWWDRLWK